LLNLITQRKQAKLIYLAEKIPNLPSKKNALNYSWPNGYKKQYLFRGCLYCKGGPTCIEANVSSYLAAPIWWGSAENKTASAYGDYNAD